MTQEKNSTGQRNITQFVLGLLASSAALQGCSKEEEPKGGAPSEVTASSSDEAKEAARSRSVGAIEAIMAEGKLPAGSYIRVNHHQRDGVAATVIYLDDPEFGAKLDKANDAYGVHDIEDLASKYTIEYGQVNLVVGDSKGHTGCVLQFDNAAGHKFLGAARATGEAQHPATQADVKRLCDSVDKAGTWGVRRNFEGPKPQASAPATTKVGVSFNDGPVVSAERAAKL